MMVETADEVCEHLPMVRALLVTVGCAATALCIMLAGQYGANLLFPVTSASPPPTSAPVYTPELVIDTIVLLHVPFWAPIAHVAACAVAAFIGGFLAARFMPGVFWLIWAVAGVLGLWELAGIAHIPKSISFSATAAAVCVGAAWLGAIASAATTKRTTDLS